MLWDSWCKEFSVGQASPATCDPLQGKPSLCDPLQKRMNEYSQEEVSWQTQTPDCIMMNGTNDPDFPPTSWTLTQDRNRENISKLKTTNQTEESKAMCVHTDESLSFWRQLLGLLEKSQHELRVSSMSWWCPIPWYFMISWWWNTFLLVNEQVEAYRGKDTWYWQLLSKWRRNSRAAVCSQEAKQRGDAQECKVLLHNSYA